jgi:hypothetical protein
LPPADPPAIRVLGRALAAGLWTRPFLLLGRGDGKDRAAEAFARAVLCEARGEGGTSACGACGACGRFDRGTHSDFHRLVPEKGRVTIGVEAVDGLRARLALRPLEGRAAAAVIPGAEALTVPAQNALLKTLEEPPPRTAILLTAAAPRALVATVRSRCATVRFPPLRAGSLREAARGLRGVASEDEAAAVAAAAGDEPGALEAAAAEGVAAAAGDLARAFAPRSPGATAGDAWAAATGWVRGGGGRLEEQRERLRMGLRVLLALHLPAPDPPAAGREGYNSLAPRARRARLAALGEARERVERYVDPVGVLEGLAEAFRQAGSSPETVRAPQVARQSPPK